MINKQTKLSLHLGLQFHPALHSAHNILLPLYRNIKDARGAAAAAAKIKCLCRRSIPASKWNRDRPQEVKKLIPLALILGLPTTGVSLAARVAHHCRDTVTLANIPRHVGPAKIFALVLFSPLKQEFVIGGLQLMEFRNCATDCMCYYNSRDSAHWE
ncbi:uncharacterized protein LOC107304716 [Oryza brachyantha]|uniref:uncharacterized protein LOC107304716 n=1 Tax=Oryza brachyantha TaxID=4533 RepID=UPI000776812A|nr:uncharacterized protein LOC107304716 [Oryza brachyantha]